MVKGKKEVFSYTSRQFIRYGLVGITNTMITAGSIFFLMNVSNASYIVANTIGYIIGFFNSFFLNKKWTFRSHGRILEEFFRFFFIFLVCYGLQLALLIFLKETVKVSVNYAQIFAMVFYTIISFLGNKMIAFKESNQ